MTKKNINKIGGERVSMKKLVELMRGTEEEYDIVKKSVFTVLLENFNCKHIILDNSYEETECIVDVLPLASEGQNSKIIISETKLEYTVSEKHRMENVYICNLNEDNSDAVSVEYYTNSPSHSGYQVQPEDAVRCFLIDDLLDNSKKFRKLWKKYNSRFIDEKLDAVKLDMGNALKEYDTEMAKLTQEHEERMAQLRAKINDGEK